jgi:hypothetical protein
MRVGRGKEEYVVVATSAATHHARNFFPTNRINKYISICTIRQILVARTLLLVRRNREEQQLDAAIVPVAGSFLSSSAAVAYWVPTTNSIPTKVFARRLSLRTSRRLGSAPVRLACTQRGPRRCLVLMRSGKRRIPPHSTAAQQTNEPPAKGHRGPSTVSKSSGSQEVLT